MFWSPECDKSSFTGRDTHPSVDLKCRCFPLYSEWDFCIQKPKNMKWQSLMAQIRQDLASESLKTRNSHVPWVDIKICILVIT